MNLPSGIKITSHMTSLHYTARAQHCFSNVTLTECDIIVAAILPSLLLTRQHFLADTGRRE